MDRTQEDLSDWRARALALEAEIARAVVGQRAAIRQLVTAVFARGHVLLQGDVGVGKTTLLRAMAHTLGGSFARTEGTLDLMPNDLIYYTYISAEGKPAVEPGPLLQHGEKLSIFFFNEINRARPQVHALLLRVMAERSVTAFNREYRFPHLLVFADRNRVEREETFEISAAARDRFMMELSIDAPTTEEDRCALAFDPRFHDTDRLVAELEPAMLNHRALGDVAASIQRHVQATETLQAYVLKLWRATAAPARIRRAPVRHRHVRPDARGRKPTRDQPAVACGTHGGLAGRQRLAHARARAVRLRADDCTSAGAAAGL